MAAWAGSPPPREHVTSEDGIRLAAMEPPQADPGSVPGGTAAVASPSRDYERYAVLAALFLLTVGCYLVVRPFLTAFLWGVIIAVSNRGLYQRFVRLVRGRKKFAAALFGLFLVAILFVPISVFAIRLAAGAPALIARLDEMLSGGDRGDSMTLGDTVADGTEGPSGAYEVEEMRHTLADASHRMPEREKIVLTL